MTGASQWRLAVAKIIAAAYAANPKVEAAFVGGSTARRQSDAFSDIELSFLWSAAPTEDERAAAIAHLGADLHRLYPYDDHEQIWEDIFFIGRDQTNAPKSGVQVEISHFLTPSLAALVDRVLLAYAPDPALHNLMAGIRDSVPLVNAPLIVDWQARLAAYPDALQIAVLNRHGLIDHFWRYEMLVARGDNRMEIAVLFTNALHQMLHLLLGLNRVYYGGFKWIDHWLPHLPLAPSDAVARIRRVYMLEPAEAAREAAQLIEETFTLIEQRVPDVDVARFRQVFNFHRPQWDTPPPLALPHGSDLPL